jgi:pimeloyl-ACP methyl ester carboxylesterase
MALFRHAPPAHSFTYVDRQKERRIAYRVHGEGPWPTVLVHGLLMDGRMYTQLAPAVAARGHRVITVDVLGHGASDQPHDMTAYSMTQFGRDVIALLDHLGVEQAVVGGTSLGANVALEVAVAAPERVRGLVLEMPVLEHGIAVAAAVFVPLALALRLSKRSMGAVAQLTRRIPRTHFLLDVALDFVRRDPTASLAVLDGLTFGRIAPPVDQRRRLAHPALVIGHTSDPIHPFSDADTTSHDLAGARLVQASSLLEWRLHPSRLTNELCGFLDQVWEPSRSRGTPAPTASDS